MVTDFNNQTKVTRMEKHTPYNIIQPRHKRIRISPASLPHPLPPQIIRSLVSFSDSERTYTRKGEHPAEGYGGEDEELEDTECILQTEAPLHTSTMQEEDEGEAENGNEACVVSIRGLI